MNSVFGLSEKGAAALSYVLGPITGIAVLIMERENKFVRFHALQSTLWFLMLMVAGWILNFVLVLPIIGWIAGIIISPVLFLGTILLIASKIYLILKALQGEAFKLPIIGEVVDSQINKS